LSLSFYPDVRSGLFKGDLHSPTADEPGQDLQRCMIGVSRKRCLGVVFPAPRWSLKSRLPAFKNRFYSYHNIASAASFAHLSYH
jgi:hypothetical protein